MLGNGESGILPDAMQALENLARDLEATAERIARGRPGEMAEEHI